VQKNVYKNFLSPILLIIIVLPLFFPIINGLLIFPETVYENNVNIVTMKMSPYLELDNEVIVEATFIQFDNRFFNLTSLQGKVDANISYWSPIFGGQIIFLINNVSLTDYEVWINGSSPVKILVDSVLYSNWTYIGGVTKIFVDTGNNVTLSWIQTETTTTTTTVTSTITETTTVTTTLTETTTETSTTTETISIPSDEESMALIGGVFGVMIIMSVSIVIIRRTRNNGEK